MPSLYLIAAGQTAEHIFQQLTGRSHTREWSKLGTSCLRLLDLTEEEIPELKLIATSSAPEFEIGNQPLQI